MVAFPLNPVTDSYSYLRQQAQRLGCNPCFDHVPKGLIMRMNANGSCGTLYCDQTFKIQCPCGGLKTMLEEDGKCCKGVFVKEE